MRAWITCDTYRTCELWLHQPDRQEWSNGVMFMHPRGCIELSDDQLFLFRPQPGECIEIELEEVTR